MLPWCIGHSFVKDPNRKGQMSCVCESERSLKYILPNTSEQYNWLFLFCSIRSKMVCSSRKSCAHIVCLCTYCQNCSLLTSKVDHNLSLEKIICNMEATQELKGLQNHICRETLSLNASPFHLRS